MIVTEYYKTREDGVVLNRTYSDSNKLLIRNDGVEFSEAVDVEGTEYTYTESSRDIPSYPFYEDDPEEATAEDYQNALREMGVKV